VAKTTNERSPLMIDVPDEIIAPDEVEYYILCNYALPDQNHHRYSSSMQASAIYNGELVLLPFEATSYDAFLDGLYGYRFRSPYIRALLEYECWRYGKSLRDRWLNDDRAHWVRWLLLGVWGGLLLMLVTRLFM